MGVLSGDGSAARYVANTDPLFALVERLASARIAAIAAALFALRPGLARQFHAAVGDGKAIARFRAGRPTGYRGSSSNRSAFGRAFERERLAVRCDRQITVHDKKPGYALMGGDPGGAAAEFQAADRIEPGVATNHYDLGTAYESGGDLRHAAEENQRALPLQSRYPETKQAYDRVTRLLK